MLDAVCIHTQCAHHLLLQVLCIVLLLSSSVHEADALTTSCLPTLAHLTATGFTDSAYTSSNSRSSSSSTYKLTAQLALDAKRWLRERDFLTMHEVSLCAVLFAQPASHHQLLRRAALA
jgi:hypothetical protein